MNIGASIGIGFIQKVRRVIVKDSFTGVSGTDLTTHPMDSGTGWESPTGAWALGSSNNAVKTASANAHETIASDAGRKDYELFFDYTPTVVGAGIGGRGGIAVRWSDNNNFIGAYCDATTHKFCIFDNVGGVLTQKAQYAYTFTVNQPVKVKVVVYGSEIRVYFNNALIMSSTSTLNPTSTKFGLWAYDLSVSFDNVEVVAI